MSAINRWMLTNVYNRQLCRDGEAILMRRTPATGRAVRRICVLASQGAGDRALATMLGPFPEDDFRKSRESRGPSVGRSDWPADFQYVSSFSSRTRKLLRIPRRPDNDGHCHRRAARRIDGSNQPVPSRNSLSNPLVARLCRLRIVVLPVDLSARCISCRR